MNDDRSAVPDMMLAMRRGFCHRCPNCEQGALFKSLLKFIDYCSHCGEKLGHVQADDIPAYFTILIVGHLVVPMMVWSMKLNLSFWVDYAIFIPATIILMMALLPSIKGTVAARVWVLKMPEGAP